MLCFSRAPLAILWLFVIACEADEQTPEPASDAAVSPLADAATAANDASVPTRDRADAAVSLTGESSTNSQPDSSPGDGHGSSSVTSPSPAHDSTNPAESDDVPTGNALPAGDAGADAGEPNDGVCEANTLRCDEEGSPEICDADHIWRPLAACEEPLRCSAGQCVAALGHECPLLPTLPRFTGTQVVDGDDADFSGVPAITYALREAPVVNPSYSASLPTEVTVRMAWTPTSLVAHVQVTDLAVQTYRGEILEYYWQGDNVQFFMAPTDLLTGEYSGTEDGGATHLVIVPPASGQPSRAIEVYEPCYACVAATFSDVAYAARTTDDGYDVELAWPWVAPNGALGAGDRVSLNLVVGASDTPDSGLELEGLLANNPVTGDTPCGGATHPGCDDRTWCHATLE